MAKLAQQDVEILRGEIRQSKDRSGIVNKPVSREGVFRQARLQRRIRIEAAARIQQEIGRAAEQETQAAHRALRAVVDDAQDLLIVGVPRLGVGQLVEVDHFIQADEQPAEADKPDETGHQLQVIVDIAVVDDGANAQRLPRIGPGEVLSAQPADRVGFQLLVPGIVTLPVFRDHLGEIIPTGHLGELAQPLVDHQFGSVAAGSGLCQRLGYESLDDACHRATIRPGPGCHVSHQFRIEASRLPACRVETPVGREVGVDRDELLLQGDGPHNVEEEGLAGAILADDETEAGSAVADPIDVVKDSSDLVDPAYLNMLLANARHDAGAQGLENGVALAGTDGRLGRVTHFSSSCMA